MSARHETEQIAQEWNSSLKANDFPQGQIAIVRCQDEQTFMVIDNALTKQYGSYTILASEHHDVMVFHNDEYDVVLYRRVE